MRALLQRVTRASVTVDGQVVGAIDRPGLVAFVAVQQRDTQEQAITLARKIAELRLMPGELSLSDTGGAALVISQFTLYADTRKGRRPSWGAAAPAEVAEPLVATVVEALRGRNLEVATGVFGAMMDVALVNHGPFTVLVDV